jgi:hypothetical protein
MHVFELDRLLSQMAQDCLDSLSTSSSTGTSTLVYANLSSNTALSTPQRPSSRTIVYDSSTPSASIRSKTSDGRYSMPLRNSIECLYTTPINQKQVAPLAPHCYRTLDSDRRPKSASTVVLAEQTSTPSNVVVSRTHKFQRPMQKHFKMKMYRSEDDIMLAVQRQNEQYRTENIDDVDVEHDVRAVIDDRHDMLTSIGNDRIEQVAPIQLNVRALARQFEQKTSSLPEHNRTKPRSTDTLPVTVLHHATARTIVNDQSIDNDDDRLTWPQQQQQQQQQQPIATATTGGIKKFVRNGLKLLKVQPQFQQQKH